jgi:twitching motility two-component system response regulator PilG
MIDAETFGGKFMRDVMVGSSIARPKTTALTRVDRSSVDDFLVPDSSNAEGVDSPIRVLHRMIVTQASGKISVSDPHDPAVLWQVFVGNGQIHFATCASAQQERLDYFLDIAGLGFCFTTLNKATDYQFLCSQWQAGRLTLAQLRAVLILITQDALLQVLKLSEAKIWVDRQLGLDPLLISLPIVKLLSPTLASLRQWQTAFPDILSPLQRPVIQDLAKWHQMLRAPGQAIPRLHLMEPFLGHYFCIYQIAQEMGVEVIKLVPLFQSLIQRGLITMQPYHAPTLKSVKPTVACVDANLEVQAHVKRVLEPEGYQVISLMDPTQVWPMLVQQQPALLLLDVDYFDGYTFAKALARSEQFKTMPVVALTANQGFVPRLWARKSGVIDCLVKSFPPIALQQLARQAMAMAG